MIQLEQIQRLEARINQAVELIRRLKGENETLRGTLDSAQDRVQKLEGLVGELKSDQKEIESCIVRALQNLERLEDEVDGARPAKSDRRADKSQAGTEAEAEAAPEDGEQNPKGEGELDIF